VYVLLRACQHFKTLSHRKETILRRNANLHQPIDPVQLTGVKKLLKVEDVADILGVSRVKVYLLLRNGLPSVKIDGARRFQPEKLQAWIEQHSA
jgi:excisionase family DNA binding protein